MNNPFMIGNIAKEEGFIGRKEEVAEFTSQYLERHESGSLAICGLPRIGKSSLVYQILHCKNWSEQKTVIAEENMGVHNDFYGLWAKIARDIRRSLKKNGDLDEDLGNLLDEMDASAAQCCYESFLMSSADFFEELEEREIKTVIYIDEFDYVMKVFKDEQCEASVYFQFMRALATEARYNISFIIVSRRSIEYLEARACGGSVFHLSFEKRQLLGFNDKELFEYRQLLAHYGRVLKDREFKEIRSSAGRVPYLLSIIGSNLLSSASDLKFEEVLKKSSQQMIDYYRQIVQLLKDEDYYVKMLEVFVGPRYNLTETSVQELMNRGYIYREKKALATVSEEFTDYLLEQNQLKEGGEIWPLLMDTECRMRQVIDIIMTKKYGNHWEDEVRKQYQIRTAKNPGRYGMFINYDGADKFIKNILKKYPERGIPRILNVIGIGELANIMEFYWEDGFRNAFEGKSYNEWKAKFTALYSARNPLAHGNPEFLSPSQINLANAYCKEILEVTTAAIS